MRVLDVATGTGLVAREALAIIGPQGKLIGLDPSAGMLAEAAQLDIPLVRALGERIPFGDAQFDFVSMGFALRHVADLEGLFSEMRRVLKPGGRFLFLEHGLSPDPKTARWQHRLTPLQRRIGGGCHLDRPTAQLVGATGMALQDVRNYYLKRLPRFVGYMTEGAAIKH
jgi:ubiquinone/menaquinone biosynthesis C-methylase UbiE